METIAQIKSQLKEIELQEETNQKEQAKINQRIVDLEKELQQQNQQRNQLDREALKLYTRAEELRPKLDKLERIANLSKEFLELHTECQDNQDLLNTLYSSVSNISGENRKPVVTDIYIDKPESPPSDRANSQPKDNSNYADYSISIDDIKKALPNAEKIYQQLVAGYLEEYKTYQNYIIDGLDLVWYAVAFIAFGRSSYRKMSFKYHPDLDGSEMAMQLINTAWSISQNFLGDSDEEDTML
ncbi:molecular chaperone DnaJ [Waterburya agarophytonicola K14]|uniref:Molecular chaperone DnaJ n=1 Tax=Waterburya agarophytonicola KI4 TaxID=2874699 RepID=A0A964BUA4_9CYAN|nr:molecular chaperone DnaJ [Waterburya agarophytonicola KI4]